MGTQISPLHVRRSTFIKASPSRVWQEFTTFDRFVEWFGKGHRLEVYEPEFGGNVELSVDIGSEIWRFGGPITVFEEGKELTFEDHWKPPHTLAVATFITFRLTPLYDGTHIELFHHGWDRFGNDAAKHHAGVESSWDLKHLLALQAIVES